MLKLEHYKSMWQCKFLIHIFIIVREKGLTGEYGEEPRNSK